MNSLTERMDDTVKPRLFQPFTFKGLTVQNRIVMPGMTQCTSPNQIPSRTDMDYFEARAAGGTGLIIAGATTVEERSGSNEDNIPAFFGVEALEAWRTLKERVQAHGCRIMPQLFHVGATRFAGTGPYPDAPILGPSGLAGPGNQVAEPMTQAQIDGCIAGFAKSAGYARDLGFDGIEIHGAHGYFIDQWFWEGTNRRTDGYGGSIENRARFAAELVAEARRAVGPDFPIVFRFSQWKIQDYDARLVDSPVELERFLAPLIEAGVDAFHCSARRFWKPEFPQADGRRTMAGWTRKISGLPTIGNGSVGLTKDITSGIFTHTGIDRDSIDRMMELLDAGEFDLISIGRSLLADPAWSNKIRDEAFDALVPYAPAPRDDYVDNTGYDH